MSKINKTKKDVLIKKIQRKDMIDLVLLYRDEEGVGLEGEMGDYPLIECLRLILKHCPHLSIEFFKVAKEVFDDSKNE